MRGWLVEGLMAEGTSTPSSLALLAVRAREGDADAFEGLMIATQRRVVSIAWRLLGDPELAKDAAQQVYLKVFRSLSSFRPDGDFHAWLYRITVNVCRDEGRRRGAVARRFTALDGLAGAEDPAEPGAPASAEDGLLSRERARLVREALETLPPRERAALVLRDLEGMTSEEVGRVLGSRPATVRAQISAARTKVKAFCDRAFAGKGGVMP